MPVALIKVETERRLYVPFGLLYLADALRKAGFAPRIFHVHESELAATAEAVKALKPVLAGFSNMTGPQLMPALALSRALKAAGIPVVWGGVHATILPQLCLREDGIDYVVRGEGEEVLPRLAERLAAGESVDGLDGVGHKRDGALVCPERKLLLASLDGFGPAWDLADVNRYLRREFGQQRVLPLITSRGCPFRCGFCYNLAVNQAKWRTHSAEFVHEQIDFLKTTHGVDGIYFHDDNFFASPRRARAIIEYARLPWLAEVRADHVDKEFARWLRDTRCQRVFMGIESGSQRVLDLIQKQLTKAQVENAVSLLAAEGVPVDLSFIIGFPGETESEREETLTFMDRLIALHPRSTATAKIYTPYPDTPLWPKALECGYQEPADNAAWARIGRNVCSLPWLDARRAETLTLVSQYACAQIPDTFHAGHSVLAPLARFRWRRRFFMFPMELRLLNALKKAKRVLTSD